MAVVMLGIAIALGMWQVERLHWKTRLLAEIDTAERSPPVALPAWPTPFEKVEVRGHFRDDLSAHYGSEVRSTATGALIGSHLLTPLERAGAAPLLVDRGWLPDGAPVPPSADEVTVVGYVRPAEAANWLQPGADLPARRFWSLDPAAIGHALGLPEVAPFTLVALGTGGVPQPVSALPRPPNDHLGYALTWFGLALCLVVVFAAFVRRTLRP